MRHRDILHRAKHFPAVAVAYPTELGQEDAAIGLVEFDLLGVGITKAIALAFLLEARKLGAFGKEVLICPLQILQCMLQWMYWRVFQPRRFFAVTPRRQVFCHCDIIDELLARRMILLLQRQRFVEYEPTRPSKAIH